MTAAPSGEVDEGGRAARDDARRARMKAPRARAGAAGAS
jgi:hypothetical protein